VLGLPSTVSGVGLAQNGDSRVENGKTVRRVHGRYCLARESPVDPFGSAVVIMPRDVASHTSCAPSPAAS
jgi:hypothetical protein